MTNREIRIRAAETAKTQLKELALDLQNHRCSPIEWLQRHRKIAEEFFGAVESTGWTREKAGYEWANRVVRDNSYI